MSRIESATFTVVAVCYLLIISTATGFEVGEMVVSTGAIEAIDDSRVTGKWLAGSSFKVKRISGEWLWVASPIDGKSVSGWIASSGVVNLRDAMPMLNRLIQENPQRSFLYYNRARLHSDQGANRKAIADFSTALALNSTASADTYLRRCICLYSAREYDRAIADCNSALKMSPRSSAAYTFRGQAWRMKGDYERAANDFREALQIYPNDKMAQRQLDDVVRRMSMRDATQKSTPTPTAAETAALMKIN